VRKNAEPRKKSVSVWQKLKERELQSAKLSSERNRSAERNERELKKQSWKKKKLFRISVTMISHLNSQLQSLHITRLLLHQRNWNL